MILTPIFGYFGSNIFTLFDSDISNDHIAVSKQRDKNTNISRSRDFRLRLLNFF